MISVVIPFYNSERTLKKCIQSILRQTYQDFEIILINDCSTDKSLNIAQNLQAKHISKIQIYNKKNNEGVDQARFDGIKLSKGEYIIFVDSDDWLGNKALEIMHQHIQCNDYDYVEIGARRVMGKMGIIRRHIPCNYIGELSQPELYDKYYLSFFGVNILSVNIWGKLYKKSTIEKAKLSPSQLKMGEDLYFNLMLFPHLKKIKILDYVGYNYRFGGMTNRYNPNLFSNLETLYYIKKEVALQNCEKATKYLIFEMKNAFKDEIKQRMIYRKETEEILLSYIEYLCKRPALIDVYNYYALYHNQKNDKFISALKNKDYRSIYKICSKEIQKDRFNRILKRMINVILS